MNNQVLLSPPVPNLRSNQSQILLSVDYDLKLSLWQFKSESIVSLVSDFQLKYQNEGFHCVKLKSFIINSNQNLKKFHLHVVALFRQQGQQSTSGDFLALLTLFGYLDGPNHNVVIISDFIEEQLIKFEHIIDFDILFMSSTKIFLALIQNSLDSNFKYELSLYRWNRFKFDKIGMFSVCKLIMLIWSD